MHRSVNIRHNRSGYVHRVYYGTRTKRTQEDAEVQATAMCALLNALKAKRPKRANGRRRGASAPACDGRARDAAAGEAIENLDT
jgi:hypothetical protein